MGRALRRFRTTRRKGRWKIPFLLIGLLLFGSVVFSEWGLGAVSEELTQEAARGYVLSCVNQAVKEALEDRDSFVQVERSEGGEPIAVHTDTAALNQLRTQVLSKLEETLNGSVTVKVPVGSLTGIALLNGHGFPVPLTLRLEASADLSFQTEFESAGINQSCHRVTMLVMVQAYSQSNRFETRTQVETSTVLAETVLVGSVPEMALLETG